MHYTFPWKHKGHFWPLIKLVGYVKKPSQWAAQGGEAAPCPWGPWGLKLTTHYEGAAGENSTKESFIAKKKQARKLQDAQAEKLTSWEAHKLANWQDERMTRWQDDRMTRWQDDKMTIWQGDKMATWQNDRMTGWQDDRMNWWHGGIAKRCQSCQKLTKLPKVERSCIILPTVGKKCQMLANKLKNWQACNNWDLLQSPW